MNKIITRSDMSARIAGYILILQSEKNHDSVERLNLADRITEVEKANNLYLDLDTQRGIVKEQKGLSATSLHKNCNGLLNQLWTGVKGLSSLPLSLRTRSGDGSLVRISQKS